MESRYGLLHPVQMFLLLLVTLTLAFIAVKVPASHAAFAPVYRGGICVTDAVETCVGGDIAAEAGLGSQVGFMKTTADSGTVPVYQSTCYSTTAGTCTAWGLSLTVNGSPVGYLSTTAPDAQSATVPLVQSNGLLLQNLGGTASAYLWSVIPPPSIADLSPTSGPVGTPVTVTGSNFDSSQGPSTVTFNGVTATPSNWSATSIVVPVPSGAATGSVVVTVSGLASNGVSFAVTGGGGSSNPTKLVVTSVNSGNSPTAGIGFAVVVQAQDNSGTPANVTANTGISLSLKTGTGTLGGTLTGTISAGTSEVTISGVTYTKAESGVVLTATRTSGDSLSPADSAAFAVNSGAASALAFTTQPGNTTAGSSISGPPTVTVRDSLGNTATSSTASITISIGTNPSGGILSGTATANASSGVVGFTGLTINLAGNGYTLTASSAGLTGATSNAFNITSGGGGGGTIAGVITRVSTGATITGALVQAYQGTTVIGSATTNSSGNYSITGLSAGTYTVQASFTGLVPQIVNNVTVTTGNTTTVNLSLNVGIAIQSPVAGATINDFSVLVTGLFDTSLAAEVGIQVDGSAALIDGDEFAAFVPIDSQTTTLTATLINTAGTQLAADTVPISPQLPAGEPVLLFRPYPAIALVSQPVGFTLTSLNQINQIQLDGNGDGTIDFTGATLEGQFVTFAEPGIYFPTVQVTEPGGVQTATSLIQVLDMNQLDTLLQSKWTGMKNALRNGSTATAADYIVLSKRANYQAIFNALTVSYSAIDQYLTNIAFVSQRGPIIEYRMERTEGGSPAGYPVFFVLDDDGIWRIRGF